MFKRRCCLWTSSGACYKLRIPYTVFLSKPRQSSQLIFGIWKNHNKTVKMYRVRNGFFFKRFKEDFQQVLVWQAAACDSLRYEVATDNVNLLPTGVLPIWRNMDQKSTWVPWTLTKKLHNMTLFTRYFSVILLKRVSFALRFHTLLTRNQCWCIFKETDRFIESRSSKATL